MSGRPHAKPTVGSGAPAQINEAAGASNTNGRGRVRDRIPPVQLDMSPVLPSSAKEADGDGWARAQEELNGLNEMMKRQMELIMVCESYYIFIVFSSKCLSWPCVNFRSDWYPLPWFKSVLFPRPWNPPSPWSSCPTLSVFQCGLIVTSIAQRKGEERANATADQIHKLKADVEQLSRAKKSLDGRVSELEGAQKNLLQDKDRLMAQLRTLNGEKQVLVAKVTKLEDSVKAKDSIVAREGATKKSLEDKLQFATKKAAEDQTRFKTELWGAKKEQEGLQVEYLKVQQERDDLKDDVKYLEEQYHVWDKKNNAVIKAWEDRYYKLAKALGDPGKILAEVTRQLVENNKLLEHLNLSDVRENK